ncbi:MAG: DEAD/DEAH box helicase [Planctomycetota bacterium]
MNASNNSLSVAFHDGTLRVRGLDPKDFAVLRSALPVSWDARDDCARCDAMYAAELKDWLRERGDSFHWEVERDTDTPLQFSFKASLRPRPDQWEAIDAFEKNGRRGQIVMPTGTGKTVVALHLIARCKKSVLIVVPVRDLMYQWHTKIRDAFGIDAGLIGDGVHRVSPVSVTTYDSAAIHMPRIGNRFHGIVFDEVHHLAGQWRSDAARMSAATLRLGLTATPPSQHDRQSVLKSLVGPIVHRQSITGAAGKTLADYNVRRIAVSMSESERRAYRGYGKTIQEFVRNAREAEPEFVWEDIYKWVAGSREDQERATAALRALKAFRAKRKIEEQTHGKFRVLEDLFRLHFDQPVLVFTGSNVMAREVSMRFLVPCLLSHCAKRERQDLLEGFSEGRYPALVANRVLDEGVDLPAVKVAIVIGGLSSTRQATQRLGRVLRRSGDASATLYEVVTEETNEVRRSRDRRRTSAYRSRGRGS